MATPDTKSVRAKFRVGSFESRLYQKQIDPKAGWGAENIEAVEMRTIVLSPVGPDGSDENRAFWSASPSGEIKLGTINQAAWGRFQLGKDYYVDFSPAD